MKKNLTVAADKKEMLPLPDRVEGKKASIWGPTFVFCHIQIWLTSLTKKFAI